MPRVVQHIHYVRSSDGLKLAWADAGSGPMLVKAANWLTHLEYEWESPIWKHWMEFFSSNFRYIRHDERGCGMTDREVGDLSIERWVEDLESVIDAARPQERFGLLGISQGSAACIAYAIKHPERVSRLVIYGGYARGPYQRDDPDRAQMYRAMIDLVRVGWGSNNPTFRQLFTSRFVPGATDEQLSWFNDLCTITTSGEIAAQLLTERAQINVMDLLERVRTPTLVMHARDDDVVPIAEGRIIAAGIPNAQFVELDSPNHVLLRHEPAWSRFCDEFLQFFWIDAESRIKRSAFSDLTTREREILSHLAEGCGNALIADRLSISEKTVRNHVTKVFDKLGVSSRAQAIVFARDNGFRNE
jgi:pimeloyl-ACP methyl ester carboxylesterase/DNA-binding CsgD family transcriptional regulator